MVSSDQTSQLVTLVSPELLFLHLGIFTLIMIGATYFLGRRLGIQSGEAFLVVNRQIPWWLGGPSIAASWIWAPALMISMQMAYQQGIAGIFWFTVPNIIAVLVYVWLGPQIREKLPQGYSLPEWMHVRFGDRRITFLYLFTYYFYQVMAVTVQVYAGAHLLSAATGVSALLLMPTILLITIAYGIISGLQASIITDLIQMILILVPGWIVTTLVVQAGGGHMNYTGVLPSGSVNPFAPQIVFTTGIIMSIVLISGSICDQQFWQRCLAVKEKDIRKTFIFGAILFCSVPIALSLLGFTAAAPEVGLKLPENFDPSLIGFAVVRHLLPEGIAILYLYMLLAGLCSTLDSGLSAASSLDALLQKKPWITAPGTIREISLSRARRSMIWISLIGIAIAYLVEFIPGFGLKYLWFMLNTIGACVVVPTVLSLFWKSLTGRGIILGSGLGLILGLPLMVFAGVTSNDQLIAATYVMIILISSSCCYLTRAKSSSIKSF